jgi:hypothetical protein
MIYKGFEIVFDSLANQWLIKDKEYNRYLKCNSLQAGKIRVSKLIKTREHLRGLK